MLVGSNVCDGRREWSMVYVLLSLQVAVSVVGLES